MKKKLIVILVALILTFSTLGSYQRAHALSLVDIPGYADEAFKAFMSGVMVVGGAGAHAGNYVEDNLKAIVDSAGLTYDQLAPHAKDAFNAGLSLTADGLVVSGDAITNFLETLRGKTNDTSSNLIVYVNDGTIYLKEGYAINLKFKDGRTYVIGAGRVGVGLNSRSDASVAILTGLGGDQYFYADAPFNENPTAIINAYGAYSANPNLSTLMALLNAANLAPRLTLGGVDVAPEIPNGQLDNIRDHLDKLRQADGSVRLGVPAGTLVEPWTNVGGVNSRVYYDETNGTWTLPDGVPIPADQVLSRPRAQGMYGDIPVVVGADGSLIDLRTGEKVASRDQAQAGGIAIPNTIAKEWEFQDTLTKNPAKEESKDDTTTGGLAGFFAKLWDWLKKILDAILGLPAKLIDLLKTLLLALFVPDADFLAGEIEAIKKQFDEKLGVLSGIKSALTGAFNTSSGNPLNDIKLDLPILNKPLALNTQVVEGAVPTLKRVISGVMVLFTFLYIYRKITGRGGVMEK